MSHIEEATTTLQFASLAALLRQDQTEAIEQHPCMALLRQAVTLVARAHGGSVRATYEDYTGRAQPTNTNLALQVPGRLPRGIGLLVDVETGALTFKGDPYAHEAFFAEVQRQMIQRYVVLAHCAALGRMHAQVTTRTLESQQVVITGVLHG
ncbi:MAG TPA: hypothetical protein VFV38_17095 [Ktedonobacteraceae bacterium]|nr:hypothetical protein [Ktedonobacteraceae bacterium]